MRVSVLKNIVEVAYAGSIRKAAKNLGIPHQTLDKNIKGLENEIGVKIFVGTAHGVVPTAAGQEVIEFAKWCIRSYEDMYKSSDAPYESEVENKKTEIILGCVNTAIQNIAAKALIESYRSKFPFVFSIEQQTSFEIMKRIYSDMYHLGIVLQYRGGTYFPEFGDDLEFVPLYHSKPYVWVKKDGLISKRETITEEQLNEKNIICLKDNDIGMLEEIMKINDIKNQNLIQCENIYYALHMISMDLGVLLDMKTGNKLNYRKMLNDIAVAIPLKLKNDYEMVTGIIAKKEFIKQDAQEIIEFILLQTKIN